MSELLLVFDIATNECTKREVHTSSRKPTKKCAMKMKQRKKKKRCAHKNVINRRKPFIRRTQRTGENNLKECRVSDSRHNEGTICLLNG